MSMSDQTKIPDRVRKRVKARDSITMFPNCIYCGSPRNIELAHYVPRSRGGRGIESNLACLCHNCHEAMDNGANPKLAEDIRKTFRDWLKQNYKGWTEEAQVYKKWRE